jgi:hypothetical protein
VIIPVKMYDLWEISHIPKRCEKFPKIVCATFMALTKLSLAGNNLMIPGQGEFG